MKKGFKKARGEPAYWDELKKNCVFTLTPTAMAGLDTLAKERDLSRSELIERVGRGLLLIVEGETPE